MSASPWPGRIATGVSLLLALAFVAAGVVKVAGLEFEVKAFENFGLPLWSMYVAGVFELIAAGLLVWRRTTTLGAIIGVGIMVNAVFAHIHADEVPNTVAPVVFAALFVWLGWSRRADFARLLLGEK